MVRPAFVTALLCFVLTGCRDKPEPPEPPPEHPTAARTQESHEPEARPNRFVTGALRRLRKVRDDLGDRQLWQQLAGAIRGAVTESLRQIAEDPQTHLSAGDHALARGDFARAVGRFRRATDLSPDCPDAWKSLAVALIAAERHDEAAEVCRRILKLQPGDRTARFNLAVVLSRQGHFADAERTYRELLADYPRFVQSRYNLAALQQSQGRLAEAVENWRLVLNREPKLASAHASLGEALTDLGKYDEAMEAYAQAATLTPDDPTGWANLAVSAEAAGSLGRSAVAARRAFEAAEQSDAGDAAMHATLGDLMLRLHRRLERPELLADAVAFWQASLACDPDQPELRRRVEVYGGVTGEATDGTDH